MDESNSKDGKYHLIYAKFRPVQDLEKSCSDPKVLTEFVFAETHLKAMDDYRDARTAQAKKINAFFSKNFPGLPLILAGDFNDFSFSEPLLEFEKLFVDLYTIKAY